VLLLGLVLLLPGAGRAEPSQNPVRLIAVGDFGVGGETQRSLGAAIRRFESRNPSDFLLTLGDNDYTESPTAFQGNWAESFGWTEAAGVRVAGVLGNHDVHVDGGRYEFGALGMPGRYYRRAVGSVELFLLDSNSVDSVQTGWLRRALARSRARWRIAVLHHPPYTCGGYGSETRVVARWVPLFERYRVQLVLSGHDHNYQRFAPRRGTRYVVHGGGSHKLYPLTACSFRQPRRLRGRVEQGFLELVIRPKRLDAYAVTPDGVRTDHFVVGG
jgi:3',5'-cyclic AMP phosphodiesterase CpdA